MRPAQVLPSAPASQPPQQPVFHSEEDVVVVDSRPAWERLRRAEPTDADAIERLAEVTDAVSLAYLVVVPDEESSTWKVNPGHRKVALDLDRLLGTVVGDAMTGRPMRVAVEVVTATVPLRQHGALRPAGELTEDDLPKPSAELFDHPRTVEALVQAAARTARVFRARKVAVLSLHYIFLSSVKLRHANTTGADWDKLLRYARATWVEIGSARTDTRADPFARLPDISPSPYGFYQVSDRYDVAAMVGEGSATLYVYDASPPPQSPPPTDDPATQQKWHRRWWR